MNSDRALFDDETLTRKQYNRFRKTDPPTSRTAISDKSAKNAERLVYRTLLEWGPMTADEIAGKLPGVYGPTLVSARSRLRKQGLVAATGGLRASSRGRPSIVWSAVGRDYRTGRQVETVKTNGAVK